MMNYIKSFQCGFLCIENLAKSGDFRVAGWIAKHHSGLSRCCVNIFYNVCEILASDAYGIDHYNMMIQILVYMVY